MERIAHFQSALRPTLRYTQQRNWRGSGGASRAPGKLNVKTRPPLAYILIFSIVYVFCGWLFLCVFRDVFVFLASAGMHIIRIHYNFLTFFRVFANVPPTVANVPPSAKLTQTSSYTPMSIRQYRACQRHRVCTGRVLDADVRSRASSHAVKHFCFAGKSVNTFQLFSRLQAAALTLLRCMTWHALKRLTFCLAMSIFLGIE